MIEGLGSEPPDEELPPPQYREAGPAVSTAGEGPPSGLEREPEAGQ